MYTKEELSLLWLDSFDIDYKHKKVIKDELEINCNLKIMLESLKDYIIVSLGEETYLSMKQSLNKEYFEGITSSLEKSKITALTLFSSNYPESLRQMPFPPIVLYAKGNLELLKTEIFAVVGSRKSIPLQMDIASNFCKTLIDAGFTLVTGIADGIDKVAITEGLKKGKIISITAGGFDNIYPSNNKSLFEEVATKGLVLSEYPIKVKVMPHMFPIRNRLIAGLGNGCLIVSGGIKSGTMYTAEYTEEFGKTVFTIPYNINVSCGAGCNELIKKGSVLVTSPQEILEFYGKDCVKDEKVVLSNEEIEIISVLKNGDRHVEDICKELDKLIFEVSPLISMLEIKGLVIKSGVNTYGLTAKAEV